MSIDTMSTPFSIEDSDLLAIAESVWTAYLGESEMLLPAASTPEDHSGPRWHAAIGVHGGWNGCIVLEIDDAAAVRMTRTMLALPDSSPLESRDVVDAVGELVNVLGGNIKSIDPNPSSLGLPMVIHGGNSTFAPAEASLSARLDLIWADSTVRISVWSAAPTPDTSPHNQE